MEAAVCRAGQLRGSCSTRDSGSFATSGRNISSTVAQFVDRYLTYYGKANAFSLRQKKLQKGPRAGDVRLVDS